jgi:copper chaperone NosL
MKRASVLLIMLILLGACAVEPEPIHYGEDNCVHCKMTIMDHRYGAEIVTDKGKVYKFDSVECLVEFMEENKDGEEKFSQILFTSFDQPDKLVNAYESHVLHSQNLPSPMGMYLTAFETEPAAMNFKEMNGGRVYCWEGLMENFDALKVAGR